MLLFFAAATQDSQMFGEKKSRKSAEETSYKILEAVVALLRLLTFQLTGKQSLLTLRYSCSLPMTISLVQSTLG